MIPCARLGGKGDFVRIVVECSAGNMAGLSRRWIAVCDVATSILDGQYYIILDSIVDPLPRLVHLVEFDVLEESELHAVIATFCCLEHVAESFQGKHFDILAIGKCRQIGVWVCTCGDVREGFE